MQGHPVGLFKLQQVLPDQEPKGAGNDQDRKDHQQVRVGAEIGQGIAKEVKAAVTKS